MKPQRVALAFVGKLSGCKVWGKGSNARRKTPFSLPISLQSSVFPPVLCTRLNRSIDAYVCKKGPVA
jgi:hypothetical protein